MKLLADHDLESYVTSEKPLVIGLTKPDDWYSQTSPVQPCSIDLRIGTISVPAGRGFRRKPKKKKEYVLKPGQAALVTTLEHLNLPPTVAAIGCAPNRVSIGGILMVNPGHVDPGYSGPMHLTTINMGKEDYTLAQGKIIVTMLFFELGERVKSDWTNRGNQPFLTLGDEDINRLSADFLNVEARATSAATKRMLWSSVFLATVLAVSQSIPYFMGWISDLRVKNAVTEERINNLERRLAMAETAAKQTSTRTDENRKDQQKLKGSK